MPSMLSFPPEVVAEVFQWAIIYFSRFGRYNFSSTSLRQDVPPINVSQVCRYWRQIALSQPSLWVFIDVVAVGHEDLQRALPRVKTWLRRSSTSAAPLTLKIAILDNKGGTKFEAEVVDSLFLELDGHRSRWEDVTLSFYEFPTATLKLDNLPMLRELHYHGRRERYNNTSKSQLLDLSTIPLLRQLSVSGLIELSEIPSNLVFINLTTMHLEIGDTIHSLTMEDCLEVLGRTPLLNEFHVQIGRSHFGLGGSEDCIHLANLNSLHISWTWPGHSPDALTLLDGIEPPSLKTLSVDYPECYREDEGDGLAIDIIHDFISRCNISLSILQICSGHGDLDILDILRISPDLQKLYLRCYEIPIDLYAELSKRRVNRTTGKIRFPLCPRLESIFLFAEISEEEAEFLDFEELGYGRRPIVNMISRRWNVPETERSLRAVTIGGLDPRDVPKLDAMRLEGLNFSERWEM